MLSEIEHATADLVGDIAVLAMRASMDDDVFFSLPPEDSLLIALVLDRQDMFGGRTALETIQTIGPTAAMAALIVQKGLRQ